MLDDNFDKEVADLINSFSNTSKTFDEKGNKDWTNKIITTMEGKPLLMIHRFKEEYLNSWQDWLKCLDLDLKESRQYRTILDITYIYSEDYLGDVSGDYEVNTLLHSELKDE